MTRVHLVQRRAFMLLSQRVGVLVCFSETGSTSCKNFFFYDPCISRPPYFLIKRFGRKFCDLYASIYGMRSVCSSDCDITLVAAAAFIERTF